MSKLKVCVLGSTGSIGVNTLDVVARQARRFEVFALSAATRVEQMLAQCIQFKPSFAVMADEASGLQLEAAVRQHGLHTRVLIGPDALERIASHPEVDAVMAAIVGAAGLPACIAAARAGKRLLLANKEALVVGGSLFMQTVQANNCKLLPIDSEHSAIFQCLPQDAGTWQDRVEKIILTASGGPFRSWPVERLQHVAPEQACAHPNWVMGRKISVDSATMMNKALEVIEAHYLFGMAPEQLEVVIHPQSVIHSMVQYYDTSVIAQLGTADMRVPIAYGLAWPDRISSGAGALDFSRLADLTFESMHSADHMSRFPCLQLAWQALRAPQGTTAVLNAANEVAVDAFLNGTLRFDQIHHVNAATLDKVVPCTPKSLDDLIDLDAQARRYAQQRVTLHSAKN